MYLTNSIDKSWYETWRCTRKIQGLEGKIEGVQGKIEGLDGKIQGIDRKIEGVNEKFKVSMQQLRLWPR